MDAVKFVEEQRRMFAMTGENPKHSMFNMGAPAEEVVREVEEWAKTHPHNTRQSKFLRQYPRAYVGPSGVLRISPCWIDSSYIADDGQCIKKIVDCEACRREFWTQKVE